MKIRSHKDICRSIFVGDRFWFNATSKLSEGEAILTGINKPTHPQSISKLLYTFTIVGSETFWNYNEIGVVRALKRGHIKLLQQQRYEDTAE